MATHVSVLVAKYCERQASEYEEMAANPDNPDRERLLEGAERMRGLAKIARSSKAASHESGEQE